MPPLAKRFALELIGHGSAVARESLETLTLDFQIFEASALVDVIATGPQPPGVETAWLPSDGCWIEYVDKHRGRIGLLLTAGERPIVDCTCVTLRPFGSRGRFRVALADTPDATRAEFMERQGLPASFTAELAAMLALINAGSTPRLRRRSPLGFDRKLYRAGILPPGARSKGWIEVQRPPAMAAEPAAA